MVSYAKQINPLVFWKLLPLGTVDPIFPKTEQIDNKEMENNSITNNLRLWLKWSNWDFARDMWEFLCKLMKLRCVVSWNMVIWGKWCSLVVWTLEWSMGTRSKAWKSIERWLNHKRREVEHSSRDVWPRRHCVLFSLFVRREHSVSNILVTLPTRNEITRVWWEFWRAFQVDSMDELCRGSYEF